MKEKEEYLESIQSKLRKLLFEEIALEDARKMYNCLLYTSDAADD